MDCCFRAGQLVILPRTGGGKDLQRLLKETQSIDLDIIYTTEEVLDLYEGIVNSSQNNAYDPFRDSKLLPGVRSKPFLSWLECRRATK